MTDLVFLFQRKRKAGRTSITVMSIHTFRESLEGRSKSLCGRVKWGSTFDGYEQLKTPLGSLDCQQCRRLRFREIDKSRKQRG